MTISEFHTQAMEAAERADAARRLGEEKQHLDLLTQAADLERQAALLAVQEGLQEPSRSILLRSAASLAVECGDWRRAEILIATALSTDLPSRLADELRDLLETVYFRKHLMLRGVVLAPYQFQMALAGKGVGAGIAPTDIFMSKVRDVENLLYRTAERLLKKPFRKAGRRNAALQENLSLFISTPRVASFAVTFQVGSSSQEEIPGLHLGESVVGEVVQCLGAVQSGGVEELESRIHDLDYLDNFIALSKNLAPDGDKVASVSFVVGGSGRNTELTFSRLSSQIVPRAKIVESVTHESVVVEGYLKFADARAADAGVIDVIEDSGKEHKVSVPVAMMADIVKPLWQEKVRVSGRLRGKLIVLEDIEATDPSGL